MLVTVRQIEDRENLREVSCLYENSKLVNFANKVLSENNYIRVADLDSSTYVDTTDLNQVLNLAYDLTNSIDSNWFENKNINTTNKAKAGCRSTSKGDIIQINGRIFVVCSIGFQEVK